MPKTKSILFLAALFLALAGTQFKASAATQASNLSLASSCADALVSSKLCEEIQKQSCTGKPQKPQLKKQVQAAVIAAQDGKVLGASDSQTTLPLPTMTPLTITVASASASASASAVLDSDKIFNLVNQYRETVGLAPFEKDDKVCELAQTRTSEIIGEIVNGNLHSGLYNRNLPYWIWENAKYGSNEEGTVAWWLSSPVHHQSIVGDYKFSCVKCTGSYCSELFTSFVPK